MNDVALEGRGGGFRIQLTSPAGSSDVLHELEELSAWLNGDDELRGKVHSSTRDTEPSHMGSIAEALLVAVGSGGAATVLASSLSVWIRQQRSHIRLSIRRPDGAELKLDVANVEDPEDLLKTFIGRV